MSALHVAKAHTQKCVGVPLPRVLGWAGLGWAGLGWDGMGWAGLGWDGTGWAGMGCAGDGPGWELAFSPDSAAMRESASSRSFLHRKTGRTCLPRFVYISPSTMYAGTRGAAALPFEMSAACAARPSPALGMNCQTMVSSRLVTWSRRPD